MRTSLLAGVVLASATALAVWLGDFFGLELESVALLGAALGAVVALVPDGRPGFRLAGFIAGIVAAWIGYLVRAALLPDAASGRAVAAMVIVLLCAVVAAAAVGRLPFWSTLVGAAALVGAYEAVYAAAPPEVASTSVSTVTAVLLTAGIGFLATSFFAPDFTHAGSTRTSGRHQESNDDLELMESAK